MGDLNSAWFKRLCLDTQHLFTQGDKPHRHAIVPLELQKNCLPWWLN